MKVPQVGRPQCRGFTLLELLAVLSIVTIILTLMTPTMGQWIVKAQEVRCTSNLRSLHVALGSYLLDHGNVWPQGPLPEAGATWSKFWVETLQPYGISIRTWQCPSMRAVVKANEDDSKFGAGSIHYTPTMFDATPGIARRWPTQPWMIERANAHGQGPLILFTDGSVKSFNKVLAEQGIR